MSFALSTIESCAAIKHPLSLLAVEFGIFTAAAFTKPNSAFRYAAITAMASIAVYIHLTINDHMDNRFWKPPVEGAAVYFLLNAVERLLISRWSYEAGGPDHYRSRNQINGNIADKKATKSISSKSQEPRFWFILELIFSLRGVGKPWQVKNVPVFSSTDPAYVPTWEYFLFRCLVLTLPTFVFIDWCTVQPLPEAHLIAANKQPFLRRLSEISSEEVIFRMVSSLGFWLSGAAFWNMIYHAVAFVLVALDVSKPSAWPPIFDSPTEAYSVRKFWGVCWHQSLRGMVDGISDFVVHSILLLQKRTLTARYLKIFLAFFLSAVFHMAWDHGAGIPMGESGAMEFFLTQAFGIVLEDGFQAAYYSLSGKERSSETPLLHRVFGYVWLILFQTWSMPVWIFPTLRYTRVGVDALLPFTLFGSPLVA